VNFTRIAAVPGAKICYKEVAHGSFPRYNTVVPLLGDWRSFTTGTTAKLGFLAGVQSCLPKIQACRVCVLPSEGLGVESRGVEAGGSEHQIADGVANGSPGQDVHSVETCVSGLVRRGAFHRSTLARAQSIILHDPTGTEPLCIAIMAI